MPLVNLARYPFASRIFLLGLLCGCLALVGWLLAWSDRGFVFSDESFYLLNAKAPASYNVANTQFGYLLQPFYALLGGDVATLRRLFILLVTASGVVAGWIWSWRADASLESRMPLIAVTGASALSCYFYWLFTPSYNLLVFVGGLLLIGAIGSLYTARSLLAAGILVGLAAVIAALAKITSAALFAVIIAFAIALLSNGHRHIARAFLVIGALTLGFVVATAALLPVSRIAEQLAAYMNFFGSGSPLGRGLFQDFAGFLKSVRGIHLSLSDGSGLLRWPSYSASRQRLEPTEA